MQEIPQIALKELADLGSLCTECGGLHVGSIGTAIVALSVGHNDGPSVPWCECECSICTPFRKAVERLTTREVIP